METFLTFWITNFNGTGISLRFIDSYKHLTYPLDSHINYLFNKDRNIQLIKTKFSSLLQHFKNDKKLKMISIVIHKYFNYPVYEITVRWYL